MATTVALYVLHLSSRVAGKLLPDFEPGQDE